MRIQLFNFLSVSAASLALCCACVEEIEPADIPDGPQPLVFTAGQTDMTLSTRAAADDVWEGDGTEYVAIKVGEEVKKYKVTSSAGALEPADGVAPFYRTDKSDIDVSAWYPYSSSELTAPDIQTDQSTAAKREACNLMTASATAVFGETTTLAFSHQTALIKVSVTSEDGTAVTGATVTIRENSSSRITSYEDGNGSYSALISPRTISSGTEFISITKDGKNYVYKLASETTFSAGNSYAYSLTLEEPADYFYVEAAETVTGGITVGMTSNSGPDINLLYSTDGTNWENFTVGSTTVTLSKAGDKVWFKAGKFIDGTVTSVKNTQLSSGYSKYNRFTFSGKVNIGGDLTTLLSDSGGVSDLSDLSSDGSANATYTFYKLFSDNTGLISAENLSLPSATLANDCYRELFSGCTSLTGVPALSATALAERCYYGMFQGCTKLTAAPELNAATLALYCYGLMFKGCEKLTKAPTTLPATTLASYCYYEMFQDCTELKTVPSSLPAKSLASYCYYGMFQGCTSLAAAPDFSATTLAESCYSYMFSGCTKLKTGPAALPAKNLPSKCYTGMFSGCASLETAPTISAESLASQCCQLMFKGCTSLTSAPKLPATTLAEYCYQAMFSGCTSLTSAPELPAESLKSQCYYEMFKGCKSLNSVTVKATTTATNAFKDWLSDVASSGIVYKSKDLSLPTNSTSGIPEGWNCVNQVEYFYVEAAKNGATVSMTSNGSAPTIYLIYSTDGINWKDFTVGTTSVELSYAGDKVWFKAGSEADANKTNSCLATGSSKYNSFSFTGEVNVGGDITTLLSPDGDVSSLPAHSFRLLFSKCTVLISAADLSLPATEIGNYCYKNMFSGCTKLTSAPKGLPVTTLGIECCFEMFSGCTKLTSAPELKATTLAEQCYAYMFKNCTSLETAPSLPATTLVSCCYTGMFQGCTKLTSAPELPATTLAGQCYQTMFQGCTKLTSAPELPATELKGNCYGAMFSGCTNLTSAPELPAETLASSCYSNMFSDCTNLTSVTVKATTTATNAFKDWLSDVASSGTIYYSDDDTKTLLTNADAIPSGWTTSQLTN